MKHKIVNNKNAVKLIIITKSLLSWIKSRWFPNDFHSRLTHWFNWNFCWTLLFPSISFVQFHYSVIPLFNYSKIGICQGPYPLYSARGLHAVFCTLRCTSRVRLLCVCCGFPSRVLFSHRLNVICAWSISESVNQSINQSWITSLTEF